MNAPPAPPAAPGYRTVLGLDLGNTTGVAVAHVPPGSAEVDPARLHLGIWDLEPGRFDSGAVRFVRLRHLLAEVAPSFVAFEAPAGGFGSGGSRAGDNMLARELLASFAAVVSAWCEEHGVPCDGVPVATLKKFATGAGNAPKEAVVDAAVGRYGVRLDRASARDANMADALFALAVGLAAQGRGLP